MKVTYKNKKLQKTMSSNKTLKAKYGDLRARKIQQRLKELKAAKSVEQMVEFRIGRCHALEGKRSGQYALDLDHPARLIIIEVFEGGAQIIEVCEDYH